MKLCRPENRKHQPCKILCISSGEKGGITLISVVMAAPDYKVRFKDAAAMLNYGFSKCSLLQMKSRKASPDRGSKGTKPTAEVKYEKNFQISTSTDGKPIGESGTETESGNQVQAPVKKGETAGTLEILQRWAKAWRDQHSFH